MGECRAGRWGWSSAPPAPASRPQRDRGRATPDGAAARDADGAAAIAALTEAELTRQRSGDHPTNRTALGAPDRGLWNRSWLKLVLEPQVKLRQHMPHDGDIWVRCRAVGRNGVARALHVGAFQNPSHVRNGLRISSVGKALAVASLIGCGWRFEQNRFPEGRRLVAPMRYGREERQCFRHARLSRICSSYAAQGVKGAGYLGRFGQAVAIPCDSS